MNKDILTEAMEVHETLNPKIFDTNDNLLPDVRDKILEIVEEFKDVIKGMTEIELNPIDIYLLGSNASYNYTDHSDMDVHIVVNLEMIDENAGLVQTVMNFSRSDFNSNYDISIHGIEVELYVEDVNASTMSNGIYSVLHNEWIKKPQPIEVPEIDIEADIDEWKTRINEALDSKDTRLINDTIDALYLLRKNGLLAEGEYGKGNQIFKEIRNLSLLKDLKDSYMDLRSQELSLENKRRTGNMKLTFESKADNVNYVTLDELEAGMIDNVSDDDIDFWVGSDDAVCKLLKSKRSEIVVCDNDNFYVDNSRWNEVKNVKKYNLDLYADDKGNKVAVDTVGQYYFASLDALEKYLNDYDDALTEALNLKTTDEVSVLKRGDWELIKDSTFGDSDEYLILKNDEVVMSVMADDDDEAIKRFWKYIKRGY